MICDECDGLMGARNSEVSQIRLQCPLFEQTHNPQSKSNEFVVLGCWWYEANKILLQCRIQTSLKCELL